MFTKRQAQILSRLERLKKLPKVGSLDYRYFRHHLQVHKQSPFSREFLKLAAQSKVEVEPGIAGVYSKNLNKSLVLDFVLAEKRKPSRYSKTKEEERLWSVMVGYTTKTNPVYDEVFTSELNKLLSSFSKQRHT